jgi:hypothetical protein
VIKALSVGIVNKMLHQPMTRLRHATGDDPAIGTVIELFGESNGAFPATPVADVAPVAEVTPVAEVAPAADAAPLPVSTTPGERTG